MKGMKRIYQKTLFELLEFFPLRGRRQGPPSQ
jgi:hypothetical protein